MVCLRCDNITIGYEEPGIASGISFELEKGGYLCIVGENGAGKSTLIKTIVGLRKPLKGSITTGEGFELKKAGYLPQQTTIQKDFPATVEEIVLSGRQNSMGLRPFYNQRDREAAERFMTQLEILPLAKRSFKELSGGQQQRVLLARALCATEDMLILDEPVAGLDPKVTEELYTRIHALNESGLTIIMITHDLSAIRYASHVLYMGKNRFFGSKEAFMQSEQGRLLFGTTAPQADPAKEAASEQTGE